MKAKLHIKTGDYEFVELDVEGEPEEIKGIYDNFYSLFADGFGHNVPEWKRVRDTYVNTGELSIKDYEKSNRMQKYFINEQKIVIKNNK